MTKFRIGRIVYDASRPHIVGKITNLGDKLAVIRKDDGCRSTIELGNLRAGRRQTTIERVNEERRRTKIVTEFDEQVLYLARMVGLSPREVVEARR